MKTLKNSFLVKIIFCLQPDLPPSPADTYLLSEARYQRPPLPTDIFNLMQNFHDLAENYQECVAELVQDEIEIFLKVDHYTLNIFFHNQIYS